jgi:hypothetical protein
MSAAAVFMIWRGRGFRVCVGGCVWKGEGCLLKEEVGVLVEGEEKGRVNARVVVMLMVRRRRRGRRRKEEMRVGEVVGGLLCVCVCVLLLLVVVVMVDMKEATRGEDARLTHGLALLGGVVLLLPVCVCVCVCKCRDGG